MGKSTVIQALLAMIQKGKNPFRGEYIDIGKISELKNKYVGSKEIEITVNQKIIRHMTDDKNDVISEGKLSDEMSFKYLANKKVSLQLHWQRRQSMDVHYYRSSLKNIQIVC